MTEVTKFFSVISKKIQSRTEKRLGREKQQTQV